MKLYLPLKGYEVDKFRSQIAVVLVTFDKNDSLRIALKSIRQQTLLPDEVFVVDNLKSAATKDIVLDHHAIYLEGENTYGGAGGFALGLKVALTRGFDLFWLLDDDGQASKTCLESLSQARETNQFEIVGPLSISTDNGDKTSNPIVIGIRKYDDVKMLQKRNFILNKVQFFNGVLLSKKVIETIGLPDKRLFIRGDEIDFAIRCRKTFRSALITKAIYYHPSSEKEFLGNRTSFLSANVPLDSVKRFYQFRNRGYIVRKHRQYHLALYDWIRYPLRFIVIGRFDLSGFKFWLRTWIRGFKYDLSTFDETN